MQVQVSRETHPEEFSAGYRAGSEEFRAFHASIAHLPRDEQMRLLNERRDQLREKEASLTAEIEQIEAQQPYLKGMLDDARKFQATLDEWFAGRFTLGALPHSLVHKMLQGCADGRIHYGHSSDPDWLKADFPERLKRVVPFVIEHDWAAAFAGATDFAEGEYRLPFDDVAFEVRADGRHVCLICTGDGLRLVATQVGDGWMVHKWDETTPPWCEKLIHAVCIAIDAEVATHEVIRASEKLNRARARTGKPALRDYHIIRLSRRSRAAPLAEHDQTERKHRLHFVRGHWRHYANHKTWIKWYLRGDPDLGFIDKHYRL